LEVNGAIQSTWGLFGILMVSTIVAVATIFLYKNRMLQIRMTIFNSLLLVGYYIAALAFYFALKNDENMFRIGWALCLPLVSIILNILAIRAIGRDEVMVKAADRLR
jgi:peptidoglycan/LPS O-acetylase OafA/YrhL